MARPGKFKQKIGKPLTSAGPGRSAMAPGQRKAALGLPNASSIAPGRTRIPADKPRLIGPGPTRRPR